MARDMTGRTQYPSFEQQQTTVTGPAYEVNPWKPIPYEKTLEFAPLQSQWQAAGIRGMQPTTHASTTPGMTDAQRQMERMALEKAQLEMDAAQAANRPLQSAMRMGSAGQWGMYVDPSQLTAAQQMAGLTGGMYGTPGGGDWRGRSTMFGGLNAAPLPEGSGAAIGAVLAANAEKERAEAERRSKQGAGSGAGASGERK